jgi:membrane protein YdbS with pleckstrin-like domain
VRTDDHFALVLDQFHRAHDDDGPHHDDQGNDDHAADDVDLVVSAHDVGDDAPVPFPRRLLNEHEVVILDLRPHWWVLVGSAALLAICLGLAIGVSLVVPGVAHDPVLIAALILVVIVLVRFVRRYARWATTNMTLTNERLILRAGVFAKSGREIPLARINDISYRQRFIERMIGAGDLLVESAGERGQEVLRMVPRPMRLQQGIHQQLASAGSDKTRYQT